MAVDESHRACSRETVEIGARLRLLIVHHESLVKGALIVEGHSSGTVGLISAPHLAILVLNLAQGW